MNIQIITSSYPAYPDDPSGTAGLFVRAFALELQKQGHQVVILPVARKQKYTPDDGLIVEPLPWLGGDRELASLNMYSPVNWIIVLIFFCKARQKVIQAHNQFKIDRTLCMWAIPAGLLGFLMKKSLDKPYDVWALGSDIWKIGKIPILGRSLLRKIAGFADRVFADGIGLCREVEEISGRHCEFLPSSRVLPASRIANLDSQDATQLKLLFVGRYHPNKGPDLLLQAVQQLPQPVRERVSLQLYGIGQLKSALTDFIETYQLEDCVAVNDGIGAAELADALSRVDFLVIPSRIESIPVVFSDALQMGTPVIATPVGDLTQLIAENDCGILADACTPEALACAIVTACRRGQQDKLVAGAYALHKHFELREAVNKWLPC